MGAALSRDGHPANSLVRQGRAVGALAHGNARRRIRGGAVGYLLQDGTFDSCIAIRTLRRKGDSYHTRAGAGIVWGSVPEKEFTETEMKSKAVRAAVASAEKGAKTP